MAVTLSSWGAPQKVINGNRQQLEVCVVRHRNHLLTLGFCTGTVSFIYCAQVVEDDTVVNCSSAYFKVTVVWVKSLHSVET